MSSTCWTPGEETPQEYADLSGDDNPVHLDPEVAKAAGFPRNIVHGMCMLGATVRAASNDAPGLVLRKLDVRFAGPSFPGETVEMDNTPKELPNGTTRVAVKIMAPSNEKSLMSPANFVFGDPDLDDELRETLLKGVVQEPSDEDVAAELFSFTDEDVATYKRLTACEAVPQDDSLPMLMGTLGLTDALWYAFKGEKPEEPGNFVHLRQSGTFLAPIRTGCEYQCRVQAGLMKVHKTPMGAMMSIPLVVLEAESRLLVQTGLVTLIFIPDKTAE